METVLIVIHLMVVASLVVVVLLQKSEGGALGIGGGGGGGFMTGRGQANALTRATAILATIFFLTSIGLAVLANVNRKPTSVFDDAAKRAGTTAPAKPGDKPGDNKPAGQAPSLFDQLKRMDQGGNAPAAPGAPAAPTVPAAPAPGSPPRPPAGGQ